MGRKEVQERKIGRERGKGEVKCRNVKIETKRNREDKKGRCGRKMEEAQDQ
jgi:hypothetical protein